MKSTFLFLAIMIFAAIVVVAQDNTDNWCDAGGVWDDGRCTTGSADEQEWHWVCGWFMAQVDNGFFTIEELQNNLPLCESLYPPENVSETGLPSANSQPNNPPPNDCQSSDPDDSDCDGLSDTWERLNFGNLNQGATDDPDGDGCDNLCEYINGSDPIEQSDDTDNDGLPDVWELLYIGNLNQNATDDPDGDGCNNGCEYANGTNPIISNGVDSDGDGLLDGEETDVYGTDPLNFDTDNDGLSDGEEVNTYGTNPLVTDSDADSLSDGDEITLGTDPLDADTDNDNINDGNDNCPLVAGTNNGCP